VQQKKPWSPCATAFKRFFGFGLQSFKSRGALLARKVIIAKIKVPAPAGLHDILFLDLNQLKISVPPVSRKFYDIKNRLSERCCSDRLPGTQMTNGNPGDS
jgi:hypothetical protein